MPPNSLPPHAQYSQNMNYPIHGNVTGAHGQVAYGGAGQPPLPMRGGLPPGMSSQQVPPHGYGMTGNPGNFPVPDAKGYYASLPKSQGGTGAYGMPPQSPNSMYPSPQGPPGTMAPPPSRGYAPSGLPPSMYGPVPHSGAPGMHPNYPHSAVGHTPHTPSSAPQTPNEVPPSPSGTSNANSSTSAPIATAASSTSTAPGTPNASTASTSSTTTNTTASRRGKTTAEKPAKATGTKRMTAKAKETAAKEAAAAAAAAASSSSNSTPNANSTSVSDNGHQGTAAPTAAAQAPLSLPQVLPASQHHNGLPLGTSNSNMMRSISPPPHHMHNPSAAGAGEPNGPGGAVGAWPPHAYAAPRWVQPSVAGMSQSPGIGHPQGSASHPGAPGQKPLNMSGGAPKGPIVPPQLPALMTNSSGQHPQQSPPHPNHLHHSRGSQGYNPSMQYPLPAQGVMGPNGPQEIIGPNGQPIPPHLLSSYPGMQHHHPGQPGHGHMVHPSQQFAHPHMSMPGQSPGGTMIPSSPHAPLGGPPTPQGQVVQSPPAIPPAHLSSLTAGRSTPTSGPQSQTANRRGPTPPSASGLPTEAEGSLYPYRPPMSNPSGAPSHSMDAGANGELEDGMSSMFADGMDPNNSLSSNSAPFGHHDANNMGYSGSSYGHYYGGSSSNGPQPGQSSMMGGGPMPPYGSMHPNSHMGGPGRMIDSKFYGNGSSSALEPSLDGENGNRKRKQPTGGFDANDFSEGSSPRLSHNAYSSDPMGNIGPSSMMNNYASNGDSSIKSEHDTYGLGGASSMMDMSGGDSLVSPSSTSGVGIGSVNASSDQKLTNLIDDSDAAANTNDNEPLLPAYTPSEVRTMSDHSSKVLVCAFDITGKYLATGGGGTDAPIRIWDVETGKVHMLLKGHSHNVTGLKWSSNPDRPSLLLSCSLDASIRLWDINNAENPELQCARHTQPLNALDWHPNARDRFICTDQMEQLVLWYMTSDEATEIEKLPAKCIEGVANKQVRYSPSGRFIAASLLSSPVSVLKILDGESQRVLHELSGHERQIIGLQWIDDSHIVSTSEDIVRVWKISATSAEFIQGFSPPGDKTYYAIPHPRSPSRILIGAYQKMYDWDYFSNKSRSTHCHEGIISCLSYSAKSDLLATTSHDKNVNLWSIPSA